MGFEIATITLLLLVLLLMGVHIGYAMGIAGSLGLLWIADANVLLGMLGTSPYRNTASWLLVTIPLFVLMAEYVYRSDISSDMYTTMYRWAGGLPGGLGLATTFSTAAFGAASGSTIAATATMARTAIPQMLRFGYDERLAAGTVAAAGSLALMIPPSIVLVLYGVLTETSIGALFMAGIVPGLLTIIAYTIVTIWWAVRSPEVAPRGERSSWGDKFRSLGGLLPMLLLFLSVLGAIYTGTVTVTEASAVGAAGALVVAAGMRRINRRRFMGALGETTRTTAMIFLIIIGAFIFGNFLARSGATQTLLLRINDMDVSRWVILTVLVLLFLALGFVMDQLAVLILTMPLVLPIILSLDFNPIWFGIIITKTVEIGLATPPLGVNVFVASSISGIDTGKVFRGTARYVGADLVVLALLIAFPVLTLALPEATVLRR